MGNPNEETYARRQHQFSKNQSISKKKSIFSRSSAVLRDACTEPPRISVDARLPNPSILTCNEPIPLRLFAKKLTNSQEIIFLQMLQIELMAYTKIIAHDLTRMETNSWVITSRSNLNLALGQPEDPVGTEWNIDSKMWSGLPLPNSVAPSFETCNIERRYELEVRVGLTHGTPGNMKVCSIWVELQFQITHSSLQPQLIVLPLRMPVKVYSGIAPPQALLDAMAAAKLQPSSSKPTPTHTWPTTTDVNDSRPPMPPRPAGAPVPTDVGGDVYDDAPPSYEDAMAENLSPLDGPRREYHPPDASVSRITVETGADAKSPVQAGKVADGVPVAEGSMASEPRESRSSSESFDMLPTTPPESNSGSLPPSPVRRPQSIMKVHQNPTEEETPPQYQPVAENHSPTPTAMDRQPSRTNLRPMNLGVPTRKPVPGSSAQQN